MVRWLSIAMLIVATPASFPTLALASLGGPQLAQLLGWDEDSATVYFMIVWADESDDSPGILRLNLDEPKRETQLDWSPRSHDKPHYLAAIDSLRKRLHPLVERLGPTIIQEQTFVEADTVERFTQRWVRRRIGLRDRRTLGNIELQVENYAHLEDSSDHSAIRIFRLWSIPGRDERVALISFIGIPVETGYEVQVPVVLPPQAEGPLPIRPPRRTQ